MFQSMFDSSTLPLLEQVVNFTQARHGVLAGNIANMDTPGYRTRDLSTEEFQHRLQAAVAARRSTPSSGLSGYPTPPMPALSGTTAESHTRHELAKVHEPYKSILRHDDNNSGLEEQVAEIAKNQMQHNLALSIMNFQFRLLRAAVTERA